MITEGDKVHRKCGREGEVEAKCVNDGGFCTCKVRVPDTFISCRFICIKLIYFFFILQGDLCNTGSRVAGIENSFFKYRIIHSFFQVLLS